MSIDNILSERRSLLAGFTKSLGARKLDAGALAQGTEVLKLRRGDLEAQLSALKEQRSRQIEQFDRRIKDLEQQLASLEGETKRQSEMLAPVRAAIKRESTTKPVAAAKKARTPKAR
ncbi:MAG: hypothetical protein IOC52_10485 [Methylobacterium sp.]|nr:hypothetical protein [Methylobacterium sp.]